MKNLFVNGQMQQSQAENLAELLVEMQFDIDCIACAVEQNFVPKAMYQQTILVEGQKIEVLAPMQGG